MANEVKLSQVVINLLSNAVKYNNQGGKIFIDSAMKHGDLVISIRDTGMAPSVC